MFKHRIAVVALVMASALGLAFGPSPQRTAAQTGTRTYEVTVTNINSGMQGLSPVILATHPASVRAWQMGQMASPGLELVAEEGMNGVLAAEWKAIATDVVTTGAHLLPGDTITLRITAKDGDVLSAATMLIQTNDGFTGLESAALTESNTDTMAYDAGTEENTERKSDVPGPPFGGKNSGPSSTPRQPIAAHPGIRGDADVTAEFKWAGAVARFTIRAVQPVTQPAQPTATATTQVAQPTQVVQPIATAQPVQPTPTVASMPDMPKTGAGDGFAWFTFAAIAAALLLLGVALHSRRFNLR